jgi:deoxyxylulose-5-phosphate synthase
MKGDDPIYVSEHRGSYDNTQELYDTVCDTNPDIVLFPFSITRFSTREAKTDLLIEGINVSVFNQVWIKPFNINPVWIEQLKLSKHGGIVLDDDYPNGIAKQIAYELMLKSGKPVRVLCIDERVAGFHPSKDNLPPDRYKIIKFIKDIINE